MNKRTVILTILRSGTVCVIEQRTWKDLVVILPSLILLYIYGNIDAKPDN